MIEKRKTLEISIETTEKQIREAIEALNEVKKIQQSDNEDLDAYMDSLSKTEKGHGGKENVSRLRQLLQTQQLEVNLNFCKEKLKSSQYKKLASNALRFTY